MVLFYKKKLDYPYFAIGPLQVEMACLLLQGKVLRLRLQTGSAPK